LFYKAACSPGEVEFVRSTVNDVSEQDLATAEVIVAEPTTFADRAVDATSLKWFQSTYAGPDALLTKSSARHYTATRLAGVYGPGMAEYVMLHVLALERRYLEHVEWQRVKSWGEGGKIPQDYRRLQNLTLGVLGLGDIGSEVAKRAAAFGIRVVACKRDVLAGCPECVSEVFGADRLPEFLRAVDYCVNILPSTASTRGLLSGGALLECRDAVFINIGRGDVCDEASVLEALEAGSLRHAVLDVFPTEPLPQSSPLWEHPRVTVTPHNATPYFPEDVVGVFAENLRRYRSGEPLMHVFDWEKGY